MEAVKNKLRQYYNALKEFDPLEPILVVYDEQTNSFIYHQVSPSMGSKSYFASGISSLYLPKKFRYGVLTPPSIDDALSALGDMFSKNYFDDPTAMTHIGELSCDFYVTPTTPGRFCPGPQKAYSLKFVTFTNPLVVWFVLWKYSDASKVLLKRIKYDKKHKDDSLNENMAALSPETFAVKDLNKRE
jgi:hypothetical protein